MSNFFQMRAQSPTSPIDVVPLAATIKYSEYMHDHLEFVVPSQTQSALNPFVTGTPIRLQWAAVPRAGLFFGYIDKVSPSEGNYGPKNGSCTTVTCVGPTYLLKDEDYLSFSNMSVDAVIKEVASQYQFACMKQVSSMLWPTLAQRGMSAWAFIVDLAKKVGFTLYAHDTCIIAVDRRLALVTAPTVRYVVARHGRGGLYEALSFKPSASSGDGVGSRPGHYIVRGKSSFSGQDFQAAGADRAYTGSTQVFSSKFQRVVADTSPRTLAEANAYIDAAESMNMFSMRARLSVRGNPTLRVGVAIDLAMSDGDQIYSGLWYVLDAEHKVSDKGYTTELDIAKDASGTPNVAVPPGFTLTGRIPATVFRGDRWSAAWSNR